MVLETAAADTAALTGANQTSFLCSQILTKQFDVSASD